MSKTKTNRKVTSIGKRNTHRNPFPRIRGKRTWIKSTLTFWEAVIATEGGKKLRIITNTKASMERALTQADPYEGSCVGKVAEVLVPPAPYTFTAKYKKGAPLGPLLIESIPRDDESLEKSAA